MIAPVTADEILAKLQQLGSPENVAGMARFGIAPVVAYGVPAPAMQKLAREVGVDSNLAVRLWNTGVHDARILAAYVMNPDHLTRREMDRWAKQFDSWAVCDNACMHLFRKTPFAWEKAVDWSERKEEFVKRAAFALIATLAVHDKKADNRVFLAFLPVIERAAHDERNFVKKAVNWALRQIGKRNALLCKAAIKCAERLKKSASPSARWIASDALRELQKPRTRRPDLTIKATAPSA
jgi:3-methyladenine DNA glycosylase AlkD